MTPADIANIAALIADFGARIESADGVFDPSGVRRLHILLDEPTADAFRARILAALTTLGSEKRIPVEIESTSLVDAHDTAMGLPVVATIHGPHELGRVLPGRAVLVLPIPTRRTTND